MWMPVCRKISMAAHTQNALRSSPVNERRVPLRITLTVCSPITAPPCLTVSSTSARAPVATQKASKARSR